MAREDRSRKSDFGSPSGEPEPTRPILLRGLKTIRTNM